MTKKGLTKYLSIGAVTTAALFLAACSNQKSTTSAKNSKTEITMWHAMNGAQQKTLKQLTNKFEKENPNIHIQMDSPSDAMTILKTRLVKENPPDIAILGGERSYADFVDADTIVDISDYKGLDKVKDVYKDMAKQLELSKK